MATEIVKSLFGPTPMEVQQQQQLMSQKRVQDYVNMQETAYDKETALLGGNVGNLLVQGAAKLFGLQDPALKRASDMEGVLQQTQQMLGADANNPAALYPALAENLNAAGFSREAMEVGMMGQKAMQEYGLTQAKIDNEKAQSNRNYSEAQLKNLEFQQKVLEFGNIEEKAQVLQGRMPELTIEQATALAGDPVLLREVLKSPNDSTQVVETREGQILINKRTGQPIANLGSSPERGTKIFNAGTTAETNYAKEVGKATATQDVTDINSAKSVAATLPKMYETRQLLETGDISTGIGAEAFLVLQRARSQVLSDKKAGKNVADTQYLNALLGSDVFPQISALGIGARGLDTPAEREYLREVMTGTISLDANTLKKMTDLRIKGAENAVSTYNKRLGDGEFEQYQRITSRPLAPVEVKKPSLKTTTPVNQTSSGTKYKIIK